MRSPLNSDFDSGTADLGAAPEITPEITQEITQEPTPEAMRTETDSMGAIDVPAATGERKPNDRCVTLPLVTMSCPEK
jgi:hypothetical protein